MPDDDQQKRDHDFRMSVVSTVQFAISKMQPVLVVLFICIAVVMSSRYLAGKTTIADIAFRILADLKGLKPIATLLMGCVGAGGVFYGQLQSKLRRDSEERSKRAQATLPPIQPSLFAKKDD